MDMSNAEIHHFDSKENRTTGRSTFEAMKHNLETKKHFLEVAEKTKDFTFDRRIFTALRIKDDAAVAYKENKISEAISLYCHALLIVGVHENPTPSETRKAEELQVTLYLNIAACYIQLEQYEQCIGISKQVLELDPNNIKATFRRGLSLFRLGHHDQAEKDLNNVISLLGKAGVETDSSHQDMRVRSVQMLQKVKESNRKQSTFAKKLFSDKKGFYSDNLGEDVSESLVPGVSMCNGNLVAEDDECEEEGEGQSQVTGTKGECEFDMNYGKDGERKMMGERAKLALLLVVMVVVAALVFFFFGKDLLMIGARNKYASVHGKEEL